MNRSARLGAGWQSVCRISWALVGALVASLASPVLAAEGRRPPNIVLILMDDMGWRDVGFMGNDFVETPRLDALARSGLVFTQAYASAPNCAPTRACLMSGQYTPRHGIYTVVDPRQPPGSPWHKLLAAESKSDLDPGVVTIAEALQSGGYATGFFGMWNLGRGRSGPVTPSGQGFQTVVFPENLGFGKDEYFAPNGDYLSDRLTDEVLMFIEQQHRNRPFFVYLPDHAVHAPYNPRPDLLAKYEAKAAKRSDRRDDPRYAATIEAVDQNVGRIVDSLARLKLAENTLVVFTSDNGGTPQYTAPLRGAKGQLYEGGIRVPLVMSWPGTVKPVQTSNVPVASVDLYPTLIELAGVSRPASQVLDGESLVSLLRGGNRLLRERLFWHFPCYVGSAAPCSAIREGDYKLVEFFEDGGRHELYNLEADPGEQRDLSPTLPEKAHALMQTLKAWQEKTQADLPRGDNPNFDSAVSRPRGPDSRPSGRNPRGKP